MVAVAARISLEEEMRQLLGRMVEVDKLGMEPVQGMECNVALRSAVALRVQ